VYKRQAGMMGQFLVVPPEFVGLNENLVLANSILVYPNPTTDLIRFNLVANEELVDIRIINNSGQVVYKKNNCNVGEVDVSFLENGNYYLLIKSNEHFYNANFIKK
jgi:serine protease AprX